MNIIHTLKWRKGFILSATFLFILAVTAVSCKKKDNLLGGDVLDQNELLNSGGIDTFQLKTFSIAVDSAISDNSGKALLGSYTDPVFGPFNANFYSQIKLSGLSPDFGDISGIVVDSFILALEYSGFYGDAGEQTFEVYRLDEDMHLDSVYYGFSDVLIQPENLVNPGSETINMNQFNTTVIGVDTVQSQLRIPLKPSKGLEIIQESLLFPAEFGDNDLFPNYYKGIHVRVNNGVQASGTGGIGYFDLNDPASKLTIYYTQAGENKRFDLNINSTCADFNHVDTNSSGTFVETVINDTVSGQKEFYAQAYSSRGIIDIPTLKNLPKNIVVHTATLVLPIQYQSGTNYSPAQRIAVLRNLNSGLVATSEYSASTKEYRVDIRSFVQSIASGTIDDTELLISPLFYVSTADRIVFNGPSTLNKKAPKLIITYTEF